MLEMPMSSVGAPTKFSSSFPLLFSSWNAPVAYSAKGRFSKVNVQVKLLILALVFRKILF